MAPTLMGDLCDQAIPPEDRDFFRRVVEVVDDNYPTGWRSWVVENLPLTELLGGQLNAKTEAKLRFAIPTEELARTYSPDDPNLSEKKYRAMKRKLIQWPFARALLYSPHKIAERIHRESYEVFMCTVKILKPKLTSRRGSTPSGTSRKRSPEPPLSPPVSKASRSDTEINEIQIAFFERMMNVMTQQTQAIENVASQVANFTSRQCEDSDGETSSESGTDNKPDDFFPPPPFVEAPFTNDRTFQVSEEETLEAQIAEAQAKLAKLKDNTPTSSFDFSPNTTEAEPKLAKADPHLVEQGRKCQRLGEDGWKNVRYADVQKTFHVAPVFAALKVNSVLASTTPRSNSLSSLEKTDLTLGAVTYGLFLQRKAFEEAWKKLSPNAQQEVQKNFLTPDSEFRKVSDGLVQYACGRRAEVIQSRREVYKPPNKVLNNELHEIPPSDTHLFNEEKLSEALKNQGGIHKFFPKTNFSYKSSTKGITKKPHKRDNTKIYKKQQQPFRNSGKHDRGNQKQPKRSSNSGPKQ